MASQKKVPFRKWVPVWLQVVAALAILIPTMLINGAYTGSSVDISSFLGVLTEDINMAYYAASAGMAAAYPLIVKIRPIATTKTILLCDLILQVFLSLLCATTSHIEVITGCSFFIGFLKAFTMLEIMTILMPIFSPNNQRSKFYAFFYPISLGTGQISLALTSNLAYLYQWQYMYYLMVGMLLSAILFVLICFRYGRRPIRIPVKEIDWGSVSLITIFFLSTIYVFTYGKTNDWFASPPIIVGCILIFLSVILFVKRQLTSESPYVNLSVLTNKNSLTGYFFMFITMFFSASSSLISSYENTVLRLDSVYTNRIYIWMLPGFIIGAVISWYWFEKRLRMRWIVSLGFLCYTLSLSLLYFQIHPYGLYEDLYMPIVLRGIAMMVLFIAFGVYMIEGLPRSKYIYNAFFMISTRSVLAPTICASIFSNWLYFLQQKNLMVLSEGLDMQNPTAYTRYMSSLRSAISQGMSMYDAQQTATTNIYNAVQLQSFTLSIKTILGYCLIACIVLTIVTAFVPFYKVGGVKEAVTGTDMV
ncbi:MAG: MFS transporter [Candidatus Azobacteroides sp.]|nr:MFS transporter [Candidatus Azobacteroides sp.]